MKALLYVFMLSLPFVSMAQDLQSNFVTEEELEEIFHPVDPDVIPSDLIIVVDKAKEGTTPTAQSMTVYKRNKDSDVLDYEVLYNFPVSTGSQTFKAPKGGKRYYAGTPIGAHRITSMTVLHKSKKWNDADMPHAMFFNGGVAIHGTTPDHFNELGKRDSGGCVRLHPMNAKELFTYIQKNLKPTTVTSYRRGGQPVKNAKGALVTQKAPNVMIVIMNYNKNKPLETF